MAKGARNGPLPWGRLCAAEAALTLGELAMCGVPLLVWALRLPQSALIVRAGAPVAAALWLAAGLRLWALLRPVALLARMRVRQEPVAAPDVEAARRAFSRAPRESALGRAAIWLGLTAALLWVSRPSVLAVGLAAAIMVHAVGVAALRSLVLARVLAPVRASVLANVDAIRVFAGGYRAWIVELAVATLGLSHAVLALLAIAFTAVAPAHLALCTLLLGPTLVPAALLWGRSVRRRTAAIEQYFDATLRAPGTRGPARDEPRAVAAFMAAQSLPYRASLYQAFSLALAGVLAVAIGRQLGGFDHVQAARLLGALALVVTGSLTHQMLALRQLLRPCVRHLGSRHHLPITEIRSRVGLRAKLLGAFAAVIILTSGGQALLATAPAAGAYPALALTVVVGFALALVLLVVRELVAPISALEGRSEEMARGELARPVPPSGEADEIGRLTVAFEEMRRSLRDRLRSTESINIDLEREVRRRTEALEQRNLELREALDKLRRAQDDLIRSEKLASMGRLVAGIAHEINNPVNAVINSLGPLADSVRRIGQTGQVEQAAALAREAQEMLAVIERGAARTKAIVQALHNYSRGDETTRREVDLGRSIDDTLDLLRHRLHGIEVIKKVDAGARVSGFPGQIGQVLMNLITNAAQAIGERGGTITITAAMRPEAAIVTVSDDGPGIPADVLPRIFDPFFTTKDVGEGSGLGLSIVHGIVERHGGTIEVDSRPGQGTTFRLMLPRVASAPAAAS